MCHVSGFDPFYSSWDHSACYDHNCKFYDLAGPDDIAGPGDYEELYGWENANDYRFYFDQDNRLGEANNWKSARAVSEWLSIWGLATYPERFSALREFIKKWYQFEIPEEMVVNEGDEECDASEAGISEFCHPGNPNACDVAAGYECHKPSGLCKKICETDENCKDGFTCGGPGFYEAGDGIKYCRAIWDPWDLVADEYFAKTHAYTVGSEPSPDGEVFNEDWFGKGPYDFEPVAARKWYNLEYSSSSYQAFESIQNAAATYSDPKVIVFSGWNYRGNHLAISADDTDLEWSDLDVSEFSLGVRSIWVAPKIKACFTHDIRTSSETFDETFCLYGGLNGTSENILSPPWALEAEKNLNRPDAGANVIHTIQISPSHDFDGDDIPDAEDNCLYIPNPKVGLSCMRSGLKLLS